MINLKTEKKHIAECNSKELLEYSKALYKAEYPQDVIDTLFEAVEARRDVLNSDNDKVVECERRKAIDAFIKEKKK